MIHLEAPTHHIPADKTDRDEAGALHTASGATYEEARKALDDQVPERGTGSPGYDASKILDSN